LKSLFILSLGALKIFIWSLLHFDWDPSPLIIQKAIYVSPLQFGFLPSGRKSNYVKAIIYGFNILIITT